MLNEKCSASVFLLPAVLSSTLLLSACGGGGEGGGNGGSSPTTSGGKTTQTNVSLSVNVTGSGQVTPMSKSIAAGNSSTFTVKANEGHLIESVTGCGGTLNKNTYTTDKVAKDCQIEAVFALKSFQITTSKSGEGNIYPESPVLDWGTEQTLTLSAATGYKVGKAYGCGGTLSGDKYSIPAVTTDCEIQVEFHPLSLALKNDKLDQQVELNVKGNAGISPTSKGIIQPGEDGAPPVPNDIDLPFLVNDIDLTTELGATVELDIAYEKPLPEGIKYYKFGPAQPGAADTWYELPQELYQISEDRKVVTLILTDGQLGDADWENNGFIQDPGGPALPKQHTVTVNTTEGGTSSFTSSQVNNGDVAAIVLTPSTGYHITSAAGCDGTLSGNTYNTGVINADCQVDVEFALKQYRMTTRSGDGGTIAPAEQTVQHGESAQFTVTAQNGYKLENIAGCNGTLQGQIFTTAGATAGCEVAASFSQQYFSVSTQVSGGGSISPEAVQVAYDGTTILTVAPQAGYDLANIEGCDGQLSGNQYTTGAVTANCTVSAQFSQREYTVNAVAGAGGQIDPVTQQVMHGNVASFSLMPQAGYLVDNVTGCSGTLSGNTYTTGSITEACDVQASFKAAQYQVTASATDGGSISPREQVATHGQQVSFNIAVNEGFALESVSGCGGVLTDSGFVTAEITQSCHVSASFVAKQYEISATASEGGSISPAQQQVAHGEAVSFQINTDTGYSLAEVTGCNGVLSGDVYTVSQVTSACNVHASFSLNHYEVTAVSSEGGVLSPSSQRIAHGQQATFAVAIAPGYNTVDIQGCGGQLIDGQFVTAPITQSCQVIANFDLNSYAVTTKVSGSGSVSPASQFVLYGESASMTLTPGVGQEVASVSGCDGVLEDNIYTTALIEANCEVAVAFRAQQFTVEALASEGGQITPAQQTVSYAGSVTFTLTPDEGFSIDAVEGCEGSLKGNLYTTKPITEACQVSAKFVRAVYPVTALASKGGIVTPAQQNIEHGQSATFELQPETGHSIVSVTGCQGSLNGNIYVTGPITAACEVTANFDVNQYSVTTTTNEGGHLSPASQFVGYGQTASVSVSVDAGYQLDSIEGCSGTLNGNQYQTGSISDDCAITATFRRQVFEVTATAASGGEIAPHVQQVEYGQIAQLEVTANEGYKIATVAGCGGVLQGNVYTTQPVTTSCAIHADFEVMTYSVTAVAGDGGVITPAQQEITHGETAEFELQPDEGKNIVSVSGCQGTLQGNIYVTGPITSECEVIASFNTNQYSVTATSNEGGQLSPASQLVEYGQSASVTVSTDTGYQLEQISGCDGTLNENLYEIAAITKSCAISARFSLVQYDVTAVASAGGSITPPSQRITHGQIARFDVAADDGFKVATITGCGGQLVGNQYVTQPIASACQVQAEFALKTYPVTAVASQGGTISPSQQNVVHGQSATFELLPAEGHSIVSVAGCQGVLSGNTYVTGPVTAACEVTANFDVNQYSVTTTTNEGGQLSPASQFVGYGQTASVSVSVDTGYQLDSIEGCSGTLNGNQYQSGPISDDCVIAATFSLQTHDVTATASSGGEISPNRQSIEHGQAAQLTVSANEGFKIASVTGCGGVLTDTLYVTGPVTSACAIHAEFEVMTYSVTAIAGTGGTVTPPRREVAHGEIAEFELQPDEGKSIASVAGCQGTLQGNTYVTGPITSACEVIASFDTNQYSVTATSNEGGQLSPASQLVEYGQSASVTVSIDTGYQLEQISGCDGTLNENLYETAAITKSCAISARFSLVQYDVTAVASAGGSITPASQRITHGQIARFDVAADDGFKVANITGCDGQLVGNQYVTQPITSACQVQAEFALKTYPVTAVASQGGTISPSQQNVVHGQSATFELLPAEGHSIVSVAGCHGVLSGNTYVTGPVTAACEVIANFNVNQYSVTTTFNEGGELSPASQLVEFGQTASVTVSTNTGYQLEEIAGCSGAINGNQYQSGPISDDCVIAATFSLQTHDVTATASSGGEISPNRQSIEHGQAAQLTVSANEGFKIASVTGCGGVLTDTLYVTGPVTSACAIHAEFEVMTYSVTAIAGTGGTVTPPRREVAHGEIAEFELQPDEGKSIASVAGCQGTLQGSTYVTGPITAACEVIASFDTNQYSVTATSNEGGQLSPASQLVEYGQSASVTVSTDTGYQLDQISGCGGTLNENRYETAAITEACAISARFSLVQYDVTAVASAGGSITPASQRITHGQVARFDVAADVGFKVATITGCGGQLVGNQYVTQPITSACQVSVDFNHKTYSVTGVASDGGAITPSQQVIKHGEIATFELQPESGHSVRSVTGCQGTLTGNTYVTGPITAACGVVANFSLNQYAVTTTSNEGGQLSPPSQLVRHGQSAQVVVSIETGFQLDEITGCGGTLNGNFYLTAPVTAGCAISATFSRKSYEVTTVITSGGVITPASQVVEHGQVAQFQISAETGHSLASVSGCGGQLVGDTYTTAAITAACQINVSFDVNTFLVTTANSDGGHLTPASQQVEFGAQAAFAVVEDEGYQVSSVTGCGGVLTGKQYQTMAIEQNCQVRANFELKQYTVVANAGEGGAFTPAQQTVQHGDTASFTLRTEAGFDIDTVTGCNGSLNGNIYTTGVINTHCTIQAQFKRKHYTITAFAQEGGAISPTTMQVEHGEKAVFTLTPDERYEVDHVYGCDGQYIDGQYETGAVTQSCTVTARFKAKMHLIQTTTNGFGQVYPKSTEVWHNTHVNLNLYPDSGYEVGSVEGCNGTLEDTSYGTQQYNLGEVKESCTAAIIFRKQLVAPGISVESSDTGFTVTWADIFDSGIVFDLYIATEPGITPDNYAQKRNGKKLSGITSGVQLNALAPNETHYIIVTSTRLSTQEVKISVEVNMDLLSKIALNDTGRLNCADYPLNDEYVKNTVNNSADCALTIDDEGDYIPDGQDADYGRDALALKGELSKVGAGNGGFDFTKLDASGIALPDSANQWHCVRDNHTGLVWEVKTQDEGLQDTDNTYTWFEPDDTLNGGENGTIDGGKCVGSVCDTHSYVNKINELGICGVKTWRLPTIVELKSIVDFGDEDNIVDFKYFPNTKVVEARCTFGYEGYWSSNTKVQYRDNDSRGKKAWMFTYCHSWTLMYDARKSDKRRVRLVSDSDKE